MLGTGKETPRDLGTLTAPVLIWGVSRSGTTWVLDVLAGNPRFVPKYQPLHSYSFPYFVEVGASNQEVYSFLSLLQQSTDPHLERGISGQPLGGVTRDQRSPPARLLIKEVHFLDECLNMAAKVPDLKVIFLIRDPVNVIQSWWNAESEFDLAWDIQEQWRHAPHKNAPGSGNHFGFEAWKEALNQMVTLQKQLGNRVAALLYEQIEDEPFGLFRNLCNFIGAQDFRPSRDRLWALSKRTEPSPYSVFRTRGDRRPRRVLPSNILRQIRQELGDYRDYVELSGLQLLAKTKNR